MEMNITRALAELKLLDKRINSEISDATFIIAHKQSAKKVDALNTPAEFDERASAAYNSIKDLIARRGNIKAAIVSSNAATNVIIGGKAMTVAEAIEYKDAIKYDQIWNMTMTDQLRTAQANANRENNRVDIGLDNALINMFGKDAKQTADQDAIKTFSDGYQKQNGWVIRNPLDLEKIVEKKCKEIDTFLTEVDYVLSESNAITKINIPD